MHRLLPASDGEASTTAVVEVEGVLATTTDHTMGLVGAIEWAPTWVAALGIAGLWVLPGLAAAVTMQRRGHLLRAVLGLAIVAGPLFVPLARLHLHRLDPLTEPEVVARGADRGGSRTVIVLDGPAERVADALPLLRRLSWVGSTTLAVPVGYSTMRADEDDPDRRAARRRLLDAALFLTEQEPTLVLAPGRPSDVAASLVEAEDDVVMVVGSTRVGAVDDVVGTVIVVPPSSVG